MDFTGTGRSVAEINKDLLERGIFGGYALPGDFPAMGQSALYCVTEVHDRAEIDELVAALREVI